MPEPAENVANDVKQPALQTQCAALYAHFEENSTIRVVDGIEERVWSGKLTATATDIGLPDGVYKRVMDQLHRMGCVNQIERGYRGIPTTIILLRPPTAEVWQDEERGKGLTAAASPAILSSRLGELERRLGTLNIVQAFAELQQQIDDLKVQFETYVKNNSTKQGE